MLGSAIPRRWVFSLALVGLVTIFTVSYSAVWSDPANAGVGDSEGVAPGSGNSVVKTDDQILESADPLPSGLVLQAGQQIQVTVNLIDATSTVNNSLPDLTFQWFSTGGVSITSGGSSPTASIRANSTGTASVWVTQVQESRTWVVKRDMSITVAALAPTSTPPPAPTNPGTPPADIPNSQGVVQPEAQILVSSTGVETGSFPESQATKDRPVVLVRRGSVSNFFGVQVDSVEPSSLPPMPPGFTLGSSATNITFVDSAGTAQSNFRLLRSAQICLPTSSSDLVNGFSNVRILRYNSAVNQWVPLSSTYNTITQQVCANSSNFSNFAVGVQQIQATVGPPSGNLPATGGWSPTESLLVLVGLLGLVLVGGGTITMLRAKNASRSE